MISVFFAAMSIAHAADDIAFLGYADGAGPRVMTIDSATREVRPIGPDADAGPPVWSTRGTRLAFVVRDGDDRVYVTGDALESGRYLETRGERISGPVWSPDNTRLAYAVGTGLDCQIAVYDLATDTETRWGGGRTSLTTPVWLDAAFAEFLLAGTAPTRGLGSLLVPGVEPPPVLLAVGFVGAPGALETDLFVVTPEDATPIAVEVMPSAGSYTEWAPAIAGETLAFDSNDGGDREIFLVSPGGAYDLSNHRMADVNPRWSPDEKWIAFESTRGGVTGLYRAHRDTGRVEAIAQTPVGASWDGAWAPDGIRMAYVCDAAGAPELFVVDLETGERAAISPEGLAVSAPAWRPAP